jgi:hypothetical protein
MTNPKPPTRLTVSGGPKATPHLAMRETHRYPPSEPTRMAHPSVKTRAIKWLEIWGVALVLVIVVLIYLAFDGGVR